MKHQQPSQRLVFFYASRPDANYRKLKNKDIVIVEIKNFFKQINMFSRICQRSSIIFHCPSEPGRPFGQYYLQAPEGQYLDGREKSSQRANQEEQSVYKKR